MNNEEQINKVIDYIEEHLQDENLTLTTIAQEIGYLKYHLYRMFTMIAELQFINSFNDVVLMRQRGCLFMRILH